MRILSLGAGVQSSTLYVMFSRGELENPPSHAIFADTRQEPQSVYTYLQKLKKYGTIPILEASHGDLGQEPGRIPLFIKNSDGSKGMGRRTCTAEYKVKVVEKETRRLAGVGYGKHMKMNVEIIMGISIDEKERRKKPAKKWQSYRYPLLDELNYSRQDCLDYMVKTPLGKPPRSACVFCPYHSDDFWTEMKKECPDEFEKACRFDDGLRIKNKTKYKGELFLHRKCIPLKNVVFAPGVEERTTGMGNECEGMCGV